MKNNDLKTLTRDTAEPIRALSSEEVEAVAGGALFYSYSSLFTNPVSLVALNPQPLPPRYSFSLTTIR